MEDEGLLPKGAGMVHDNKRTVTDIVVLIIFGVAMIGFISIGGNAISSSTSSRLTHGSDFLSQTCGTTNTARDLSNEPYLYIGSANDPERTGICLEACPDPDTSSPHFGESPDDYVCRYEYQKESLAQKKGRAATGDGCWLAYKTRANLNGCFSESVKPIVRSSQISLFADVLSELGVILLYGSLVGFTSAWIVRFAWVELTPRFDALLCVGLFYGLVLLNCWWLGALGWSSVRKESQVEQEMENLTTTGVVVLCLSVVATVLLGNHVKDSSRALKASENDRFEVHALLAFVVICHVIIVSFTVSAVAAVASQGDITNDSFSLDQSHRFVISFLVVASLWLMSSLNCVVYLQCVTRSLHCFNDDRPKPQFPVVHFGTVAIVSPFLFLLEVPLVLVSLLLPFVSRLPVVGLAYPYVLFETAHQGTGAIKSLAALSTVTTRVPGAAPANAGTWFLALIGSLGSTVLCAFCAWPTIADHTSGNAVISSVTGPLVCVFLLSLFVAKLVLMPVECAVVANVFHYANGGTGVAQPIVNIVAKYGGGDVSEEKSNNNKNTDGDNQGKKAGEREEDEEDEEGGRQAVNNEQGVSNIKEAKNTAAAVQAMAEEGLDKAEEQMEALLGNLGLQSQDDLNPDK